MNNRLGRAVCALATLFVGSVMLVNVVSAQDASGTPAAAYDPKLVASDFVKGVDNPYFPLTPGTTYVYEGTLAGTAFRTKVTVTHDSKRILGIDCVVVRDTVMTGGQVTEDTWDWYAQDRSGTVWYMGEDTRTYENGKISGTEGTWEAGVDGAKAGIIMQAKPTPGDSYRQEYSAGVAEDRAQVVEVGQTATVKAGAYSKVVVTDEQSDLEPAIVERKSYAPGVGNVLNDAPAEKNSSELVSITVEPAS